MPYDFKDEFAKYQWHEVAATMVQDELRELTNILNHWHGLLLRWHSWNEVLGGYNQEEAWDLRQEFLGPLAHCRLLSPSAARDTLTFVATNALHQLRIALESDYMDHLEGDPIVNGKAPKRLNRAQKEQRLQTLASPCSKGVDLVDRIKSIDDKSCRAVTADYRNRSSHAIGLASRLDSLRE